MASINASTVTDPNAALKEEITSLANDFTEDMVLTNTNSAANAKQPISNLVDNECQTIDTGADDIVKAVTDFENTNF